MSFWQLSIFPISIGVIVLICCVFRNYSNDCKILNLKRKFNSSVFYFVKKTYYRRRRKIKNSKKLNRL